MWFVRCLSCLVAWVVLLCSQRAEAGGLFVPDIGARALSRGGAYAATGDDLTALWYNPANLAAKQGIRFEVDLTLNFRSVEWQRADDASVQATPFAKVDNRNASPIPVPSLFAAYDFGVKGLAVALGIYAPMNGTLRFSDSAPSRYTVVRSGSFVVYFHLGIAYQILPWLRVGAGFTANSVFFDQRLAVNLGLGAPEDPKYDIMVDIYGTQHFLVNGNVGIWLTPGAGFEIGASFFPGRQARPRGTAKVTPPRGLAGSLVVNGNQADFEINFPWIVRGGLGWRGFGQRVLLEANYVFEGWSSLQSIKIIPKDVSISFEPFIVDRQIPTLDLERRWKDTHSLRVGAEVVILASINLVARAGYIYETGAVPDQYVSVGSTDTTKHAVTVGAGVTIGPITMHLGYAHHFFDSKSITDSQMKLTNPLDATNTNVIGNGQFSFSHDMLTLGVGGQF